MQLVDINKVNDIVQDIQSILIGVPMGGPYLSAAGRDLRRKLVSTGKLKSVRMIIRSEDHYMVIASIDGTHNFKMDYDRGEQKIILRGFDS